MANILIVEDEQAIRDLIKFSFSKEKFHIFEADSVDAARSIYAKAAPDIILLDWMLPGEPGTDYVKELRANPITCHVPIIMLTARAEEVNKIKGFEAGADDYVTKPFSPRELLARVKSVLSRGRMKNTHDADIEYGPFQMNTAAVELKVNQESMTLTDVEFRLMKLFLKNPGRVYSRDQLLNQVWGYDTLYDARTVDARIKRLRENLDKFELKDAIETIRQVGYRLREF